MAKRKQPAAQQQEDTYGQAAGAIGILGIAFAGLGAVKDKLGLSWPVTVLLTAGTLVTLGYAAWRIRRTGSRMWARGEQPAAGMKQEPTARSAAPAAAVDQAPAAGAVPGVANDLAGPGAPVEGAVVPAEGTALPVVQAHPELTSILRTAGAIGRDHIIREDETEVSDVQTGALYEFLVPEGRTYEDVEKRLGTVAGMFGVTRLHLKLERSRDNERRVKLLKLHEPPFTRPFPPPSRQEIEKFAPIGVPIGHDVTGQLVGVPTFDKASLLVAGMTQMGKTTLVNGLITCLLIAYGEFELYLLDGKFCGLTRFEKIATRYESSDDPDVYEGLVDELNARSEGRYAEIKEAIVNRMPRPRFKPVIFIVDEAADFFAHDESKEGKERARRIAEKTRGLVAKSLESEISTVLMTQRPSTNAIPVMVRDQFLYRLCLYVASSGTAKVALGDTYFETVAPINPALLDPDIKGQGVLFANGRSTLIRGFNFTDEFIWGVVDEVRTRQQKVLEEAPDSPLKRAVAMMQEKGVAFMYTSELAPALGVSASSPGVQGRQLSSLLGVTAGKDEKGLRGYHLADLVAALKSGS